MEYWKANSNISKGAFDKQQECSQNIWRVCAETLNNGCNYKVHHRSVDILELDYSDKNSIIGFDIFCQDAKKTNLLKISVNENGQYLIKEHRTDLLTQKTRGKVISTNWLLEFLKHHRDNISVKLKNEREEKKTLGKKARYERELAERERVSKLAPVVQEIQGLGTVRYGINTSGCSGCGSSSGCYCR